MKTNKLILLVFSFFLILIGSCTKNTDDDLTEYLIKWKLQNETYFNNMKDSVGYQLYTIPVERGGNSFYYKITTPGNANSASPLSTDYVTVHYRGKMINGLVFDQTYTGTIPANDAAAQPANFCVNQLIYGWTENLMQMKVGETRTIVLPQELAYGNTGVSHIPPYTTLIFDIQLISIGIK